MLENLVQETCMSDMLSCTFFLHRTVLLHKIEHSLFPHKFVKNVQVSCNSLFSIYRIREDNSQQSLVHCKSPF